LKKFLLIIFCFFSLNSFAQKPKVKNNPEYDYKRLHFGFTLGLNIMDFKVYHSGENYNIDSLYVDVSQLTPGFHIQIVSNLRVSEYFDLRFLPGISFGQRYLQYIHNSAIISEMRMESSFLEFPLLLKYKSKRLNNFRPYLIGGFNGRIDMAARKEYDEREGIHIQLKPFDLYYEVGFGIDFYLPYFKFSIELKAAFGMRNVLVPDADPAEPQYTTSIDRLNSTLVLLSFNFE